MVHLMRAPHFATNKRISVPDEEPEVFSAVLEYLYKADYRPFLEYDADRQRWSLASTDTSSTYTTNTRRSSSTSTFLPENTVYHAASGWLVLKDTAVYCAAEKYELPELKRLALKKQGLQTGVNCTTILNSARFAYRYTPESDSRLRAHYLALIIRCAKTFKKSGTMQVEMEKGGTMFFDLFVALVEHLEHLQGQ